MGFKTAEAFELEPVSKGDLMVATTVFGFTMGFMYFTALHAWRQTRKFHVFTVLIWAEVAVCLGFAVECILYLGDVIPHSFFFYFSILTMWALQVQLLLQIIINRICMLWANKRHKFWLKYGVAALITAINIAVYCIWVPARLQISHRYIIINDYWDRTEKILYAVTDAILNALFIRTVKTRLVDYGLKKYDRLVKFNVRIIGISLMMDVMIIAMMSYPNSFVYMQFHPLAYIVKLNIELAMGELIVKIARETNKADLTTTIAKRSTADGLTVNVVTNTNVTFEGNAAQRDNTASAVTAIAPPPNAAHRDVTGRLRPHAEARARVRPNVFTHPTRLRLKRRSQDFDDIEANKYQDDDCLDNHNMEEQSRILTNSNDEKSAGADLEMGSPFPSPVDSVDIIALAPLTKSEASSTETWI